MVPGGAVWRRVYEAPMHNSLPPAAYFHTLYLTQVRTDAPNFRMKYSSCVIIGFIENVMRLIILSFAPYLM